MGFHTSTKFEIPISCSHFKDLASLNAVRTFVIEIWLEKLYSNLYLSYHSIRYVGTKNIIANVKEQLVCLPPCLDDKGSTIWSTPLLELTGNIYYLNYTSKQVIK